MSIKNAIKQLAIFGGAPLFEEKLHVGCPNIGNRERFAERMNEAFDRKWLTNNGPLVKEFEARIADLIGVTHCVTTCNGTVALEAAVRALGLEGEVILPSFTFVATAHVLECQNLIPVFCDIDEQTGSIDPKNIEGMITPRTTGIIGVNLWGRPCEIGQLEKIAANRGLKLLFDSAHAFGCTYKNKKIGTFGNAEIFSFHATKVLNSFEGGAVVTNDSDLALKIRLIINFGFSGYDNVVCLGINGKMCEAAAAMGLTNLESLQEFIEKNYHNYRTYQDELRDIQGIRLQKYDESEKSNYQYIILEIDEHKMRLSRDEIVNILHAENILARRYFYPGCHRMEPYKTLYPRAGQILQKTERKAGRILALPTGTSISPDKVKDICHIIRLIVANGKEISKRINNLKTAPQCL